MLYEDIRKQIVAVARTMVLDGLVRGTSGNVSCRIAGSSLFAVTPSGMDYHTLGPEDVVIVDALSGRVVNGHRRPSIETPLHRYIMQQRPDVNGVVHTHSVYASAFACLALPLPVISTELAALVGGTVPCMPYMRSGSDDFARSVLATLQDGVACLFQNHGALAVGRTLKEAYTIAMGLEEAAQIYHLARQMGEPIILPESEREFMFRFYRTSYGQVRSD